MVTAIKSKSEKLKTKAIFLLKNIAEEHSEAKGKNCCMNVQCTINWLPGSPGQPKICLGN